MQILKKHFLLVVICVVSFISHCFYIAASKQYPVWDEHHYLSLAVQQYDLVRQQGVSGIPDIFTIATHRQPLYSIFIMVFLLLFGTSHTYMIALVLNGLCFVASIIGVYILASSLFHKTSGILSALIFATFGNVLFYNHFSYTETITTTMVIYSLVLLYKTHCFQQKQWSILAGVYIGLSFLTRWIAPVFILGAMITQIVFGLLIPFLSSNKKHTSQSIHTLKTPMINIALCLLPALLIPIILYLLPNYSSFLDYVSKNQGLGAEWVAQYRSPEMANTASVRSIMYYFNILQQNTIWIFLLFVLGIATELFIVGKHTIKFFTQRSTQTKDTLTRIGASIFILSSFILPYAFLTFVTIWKEDRFIVPLYPVMAIISSLFLIHVRPRLVRKTLIVVTVGICILNAIGAQWALGPMGQQGLKDYITPRWLPHPRRFYLTPLVWPPNIDKTSAESFITAIKNDWTQNEPANLKIDIAYEPLHNALSSRSMYEVRTIYTVNSQKKPDYILSTDTTISSAAAVFSSLIPAIGETGIVYKVQ